MRNQRTVDEIKTVLLEMKDRLHADTSDLYGAQKGEEAARDSLSVALSITIEMLFTQKIKSLSETLAVATAGLIAGSPNPEQTLNQVINEWRQWEHGSADARRETYELSADYELHPENWTVMPPRRRPRGEKA